MDEDEQPPPLYPSQVTREDIEQYKAFMKKKIRDQYICTDCRFEERGLRTRSMMCHSCREERKREKEKMQKFSR